MSGQEASPFHTTRWSLVLSAGKNAPADSREAFGTLAQAYWPPLYTYLRRRGLGREDACDLIQGLFARLLERDDIATADPERGRFRSFLLTCLENYWSNERERQAALKRGGGHKIVSLDAQDAEAGYLNEPSDHLTPEAAFEKAWARSMLDRALSRLEGEMASAGKADQFAVLRDYLVGGQNEATYRELGGRLGMSETAVKVAVHRLRGRFARSLREEVAQTLSHPADVDSELHFLIEALGR